MKEFRPLLFCKKFQTQPAGKVTRVDLTAGPRPVSFCADQFTFAKAIPRGQLEIGPLVANYPHTKSARTNGGTGNKFVNRNDRRRKKGLISDVIFLWVDLNPFWPYY